MPGLERRERRRGVLLLPLSCPDLRRGGEEGGGGGIVAATAMPELEKRGRRGREGVQLLLLLPPCLYLRREGGEAMLQRGREFDVGLTSVDLKRQR